MNFKSISRIRALIKLRNMMAHHPQLTPDELLDLFLDWIMCELTRINIDRFDPDDPPDEFNDFGLGFTLSILNKGVNYNDQ